MTSIESLKAKCTSVYTCLYSSEITFWLYMMSPSTMDNSRFNQTTPNGWRHRCEFTLWVRFIIPYMSFYENTFYLDIILVPSHCFKICIIHALHFHTVRYHWRAVNLLPGIEELMLINFVLLVMNMSCLLFSWL